MRDDVRQRLARHRLSGNPCATAREVVAHFGAVQAQDCLAVLWAVGLRMREATQADVEREVAERRIVRWMLELLGLEREGECLWAEARRSTRTRNSANLV